MKAFLDTHAAVFLWEGRVEAFGASAQQLLERAALFLSPLVRLELVFLKEVGKIKVEPDLIVGTLLADCGVSVAKDPIDSLIALAIPLSWTRDPFDRLLVATALLHRAPFVTRDRGIHEHFSGAVW